MAFCKIYYWHFIVDVMYHCQMVSKWCKFSRRKWQTYDPNCTWIFLLFQVLPWQKKSLLHPMICSLGVVAGILFFPYFTSRQVKLDHCKLALGWHAVKQFVEKVFSILFLECQVLWSNKGYYYWPLVLNPLLLAIWMHCFSFVKYNYDCVRPSDIIFSQTAESKEIKNLLFHSWDRAY